tara:strand:- start:62 stop:307 length:246 start_codon:yes stop_codon:yes gene_type:complete
VGLKGVTTLSANLFGINVKTMAVLTEFQRETILMKKTKQEKENQELERIDGKEWEDDGLDYEDLYYDDSSEVDYGLEYTLS